MQRLRETQRTKIKHITCWAYFFSDWCACRAEFGRSVLENRLLLVPTVRLCKILGLIRQRNALFIRYVGVLTGTTFIIPQSEFLRPKPRRTQRFRLMKELPLEQIWPGNLYAPIFIHIDVAPIQREVISHQWQLANYNQLSKMASLSLNKCRKTRQMTDINLPHQVIAQFTLPDRWYNTVTFKSSKTKIEDLQEIDKAQQERFIWMNRHVRWGSTRAAI